jgi:squalene-associated FAD-dependent desaturase
MALNHVHIVGAGMAGLSAAVTLAGAGVRATLYEAGPAAGGRCRSYFDKALGLRIDNGNHLLLSGNDAAMDYLTAIGARDTLRGPGRAVFPFIDVASGERWTVEPGPGRIPWWILTRRVPGTRLADYLALDRLRKAPPEASVAEVLGGSELYRKLLEPLAISGLNTMPEEALASLLWAVVEGSLLRGGSACEPLVPREGLSESLVDPAIAFLAARGSALRTGARVSALDITGGRVAALALPWGRVETGADEAVVMAVPPWVAEDLLPGIAAPKDFEAIVNLHFRVGEPDATPDLGPAGFVGVIGGIAEWVFAKPGILSVTISAANRYADTPNETLAARAWDNICHVTGANAAMPPYRAVREKRATFAATAASEASRPAPDVGIAHFAVAGDWTSTLLPSTIEGAIRSGRAAAVSLLSQT